jgi:hypothetical protein
MTHPRPIEKRTKFTAPRRVPTQIPKGAEKGTRLLKKPRPCGLSDLDRATRSQIPSCKRPAFYTVPDTFFGLPWRLAICRHHLMSPPRCYWPLRRPKNGRFRCRKTLGKGEHACSMHRAAYDEMMGPVE